MKHKKPPSPHTVCQEGKLPRGRFHFGAVCNRRNVFGFGTPPLCAPGPGLQHPRRPGESWALRRARTEAVRLAGALAPVRGKETPGVGGP
eukprot:1503672-Rhodomonas_salina.3